MDEITLRDFRCFGGKQSARLAPLTLVVGENSTGKTSFLALIRALWEVAYNHTVPDFKEEPYDLGSFAEIAHHRGGRAGRAHSFEAGFHIAENESDSRLAFLFDAEFEEYGTAPVPVVRRVSDGTVSVSAEQRNGSVTVTVCTPRGERKSAPVSWGSPDEASLLPMYLLSAVYRRQGSKDRQPFNDAVENLLDYAMGRVRLTPFASAPVRSKPRRTYDPARSSRDPEGDYVPMYLAHTYRHQNKKAWSSLKVRLEAFGQASGLFDELSIKSLGPRESQPFQIQVRKRGERSKGPWRNLIDVGYGVSQVLPLITELLRPDAPSMFLLQQPEVHLHPSAQAALGSLFCEVAAERQLVIETHSDHLINRIRLDVRDRNGSLTPADVSILYFERGELEVNIHSLRLDEQGNLLDAPPDYGRFFIDETERSLRH